MLVDKPVEEKELSRRLLQYVRDKKWIRDNYSTLAEQNNNMYIAVRNETIHLRRRDIKDIINAILNAGNNVSDYAIEFLTKEKTIYLL